MIEKWAAATNPDVRVTLVHGGDSLSREVETFLDELVRVATGVSVKTEPAEGDPAPAVRIRKNIVYRGVPQGRELVPFLYAIAADGHFAQALTDEVRDRLSGIRTPALFTVYMSPACPHCPRAVETLVAMGLANDNVFVTVIDAGAFQEEAEKEGVRAVPTVILDGDFRWTGNVSAAELVDMAVNRDPSAMGAQTLKAMLGEGQAEQLAGMMTRAGKVFPGFLELATDPKWSTRLGAMVAFEYLTETAPDLAVQASDSLWERFPGVDDSVKGDILLLIGQSGNTRLVPEVRKVADGDYPAEVREAAAEALDELGPGADA
ncbi:MAG: thioredoxin family protein [Desulfatibacillaceae bacterium]